MIYQIQPCGQQEAVFPLLCRSFRLVIGLESRNDVVTLFRLADISISITEYCTANLLYILNSALVRTRSLDGIPTGAVAALLGRLCF